MFAPDSRTNTHGAHLNRHPGRYPLGAAHPFHERRIHGARKRWRQVQDAVSVRDLGGARQRRTAQHRAGDAAHPVRERRLDEPRLAPLGRGLATLAERLGPLFEDTTVIVMSEFGRTARQNGNGGTDHGHGNVMWLMGGGVAGGKVYGDWQGVADGALHEGRDLPVTTDFRSVLAQVAERQLRLGDSQLAQLFPAMPKRAPAFRVVRG